jgi:hypothetical protein
VSIPDNHHYVRNVGGSSLHADNTVDGVAFRTRPVDVDGLSGNWPEFFAGLDIEEALAEIRKAIMAKGRKIAAQSKFAVLNVGTTKTYVRAMHEVSLDFRHTPEEPFDPSHASIFGYSPEDDITADLIAQTVHCLLPGRGN